MAAIVTLCAQSQCLEIDANGPNWWHCYLVSTDARLLLGAHRPEYIVSTLLATLFVPWEQVSRSSSGYMNGYEVKPSLLLYEGHSSLYIADEENGRVLFWWDARGNLLSEMHVSQDELQKWHEQLLAIAI